MRVVPQLTPNTIGDMFSNIHGRIGTFFAIGIPRWLTYTIFENEGESGFRLDMIYFGDIDTN